MDKQTPRLRILVVDNDPVFREIVADILSKDGHEVLIAADGLAALEILEQHTPDIFLIDLIMPGIDGEKLCRTIRANPRFDRALLVMLSAAAAENEAESVAAGADLCMAKASRRELTERFRKLFTEFRQGTFAFPAAEKESGKKTVRRGITWELLALRHHGEMLLDNLADGVVELALPTGKILYANHMATVFLGQSEEKLLGIELPSLFPEGLRSEVRQIITAAPSPHRMERNDTVLPFKGRLLGLSALLTDKDTLFFLRDVTAAVQGEQASRLAHAELDQIFNSSPDAQIVIDLAGNIVRMNRAYKKMFQVEEQEGRLMQCCDLSAGPRCDTDKCSLRRILAGEPLVETEEEKRLPDGSTVPVHIMATPLRNPEGQLIGIIENCRDITERRRQERALRETFDRFQAIFDNTLVGIFFVTRDRIIADLNDRAAALLGYSRGELIGQKSAGLHLSPTDFDRFGEEVRTKTALGSIIQMEHQLRRKDGSPVWVIISGKAASLSGLGEGMLWVVDDITRRKQAEDGQRQMIEELREVQEALRNQSIRDPLTGLFNRRYMEESLQREISKARRHATPLALFMLDIDHFKEVNDAHGHAAGDWVLRQLGGMIQHSIREEDIACRFGGEEFILILPNISAEHARRRAEEFRAKVEQQLIVESMGQPVGRITISIGIAMHNPDSNRDTLMQEVDNALYRAKDEGRNRVAM